MNLSPTVLLLATSGVIAFFAFMPLDLEVQHKAMSLTFNAGHFPAFFVLAITIFRSQKPTIGVYRKSALICLVFAILIELIQPLIGRIASIYDLLIGMAGAVAGLIGVALWRQRAPRRAKLTYAGLVTGAVMSLAYPAAVLWFALTWQNQLYPRLGDFESKIELTLWVKQGLNRGLGTRTSLSSDHVSQGQKSLRLETIKGAWAGLRFDPGQMNWAQYDSLGIDVYNPDDTFTLNIRIDDNDSTNSSDRFQKPFLIRHGWNQIKIGVAEIQSAPPLRPLHTDAIRKLFLYTGKKEPPRVFYVDNVRLENALANQRG